MGIALSYLSALRVKEAIKLLKEHNIDFNLIYTGPTDRKYGLGDKRVITARMVKIGVIDLIWSYEKYK
ncbi:hypothetical protein GM661_10795 [Iocasia frigidifontis]|uniref:Uncharacterized protein n=1 Tax=Iocasia fonsfrigidae TaxID=2682810 RepID=A0A8A7KJX8_9FIRM|nr:hypothetical protein [Iocasia fonsfrigidae]QTL98424.1 hypothetical protein GM661_10795 [Iocasia fonsfrigidae]